MKTASIATFAAAPNAVRAGIRSLGPLLACVVCLALLLGCGSDSPTKSKPADTLIPLASGNTWTYRFVHYGQVQGSLSLSILGMMEHLDDTYYRLSEPYLAESQPGTDRYTVMRNGAEGLYWCDNVCGSPEGRYPASCDGAFFQYPTTDGTEYTDVDTCGCLLEDPVTLVTESVTVRVAFDTIAVPAGTFDVISYTCTEPGATGRWTYSFSPGVGLILMSIDANGVNEGTLELESYSVK